MGFPAPPNTDSNLNKIYGRIRYNVDVNVTTAVVIDLPSISVKIIRIFSSKRTISILKLRFKRFSHFPLIRSFYIILYIPIETLELKVNLTFFHKSNLLT